MLVSLRLRNRPPALQPQPAKLNPIPYGGENQNQFFSSFSLGLFKICTKLNTLDLIFDVFLILEVVFIFEISLSLRFLYF